MTSSPILQFLLSTIFTIFTYFIPMYIFISIVVLLLIIFIIYGVVIYNSLMTLARNKDNALIDMDTAIKDMFTIVRDMQATTWAHRQVTQAHQLRTEKKQMEEKITGRNMLLETITKRDIKATPEFQKLQEKTLTPRRYFNHNTKKINDRLATFPWNFIGSFLGYSTWWFLTLTDKEKEGEGTDVKR